MRPLDLKIQGFTCFSDAVEVDFRGMDVFAIIGPTGAGKTTIVDAICYALYGRVPRQDGTTNLISHDRDVMSVDFEFEVGGAVYRVHRGVNRSAKNGRRTMSPVQLEVLSEVGWEPIADRVRSLDEEIARVVGLDFKGFTSCVLLPQGRFQEFLAGDKKERREVLKELLDSGVYEQVMVAANARAAQLQNEANSLARRLEEDYASATPAALAARMQALAEIEPRLEAARSEHEALLDGLDLARQVVDARGRERDYVERRYEAVAQLKDAKELAEAGQERLAGLRDGIQVTSDALRVTAFDRERGANLRLAVEKAERRDGLGGDLVQATERANDASAIAMAAATRASATQRATAALICLETAKTHLAETQRLDVAAHLRQGLQAGDTCPVCGGVIGEPGAEAAVDLAAAESALGAVEREEKAARDDLGAAERELIGAREREEQWRARRDELAAAVEAAAAAVVGLLPAGLAPTLAAIRSALATEEEQAARHEALSSRIASLREELDGLALQVTRSDQEIARLEAAAAQLESEATAAATQAEAAKEGLVRLGERWCWREVLEQIETRQDPRRLLSERQRECQAEAEGLNAQQTSLAAEVERLEQAIERAAALTEEMAALKQRGELYRELGRLLRADAFQAFVIEEAMVALAATASSQLELLYPRFALTVGEGEFQIIDHWQADQVRSARTLSGGETFAASLALALALAERLPELRDAAAASLESLFLDEGFGTLDQATLDTVIGALEGLRSEERVVGVITHVPELAKRIECRIEVEKSPAGSNLSVVGA